ncbi:hypothetical protein DPMN_151297 [Dreissena polymorpha]|uniref:Uncharacterized protein n=1 Tax=Dreissena polymorpha TaxID=45954 RepID=A0A9D4FFB7_DREPO|nr:hypothetical protein DPMN_151297 [Dreissena polymorpha]
MDQRDKRRDLMHEKYTSLDCWVMYQKANRDVRKTMQLAQEEWISEQSMNIDKKSIKGSSKKALSTIMNLMTLVNRRLVF